MAKADMEPTIEIDEQAVMLAAAAALLSKAATDKLNRPAILKEVEAALGKLSIKDFPELADSPVVRAFLQAMGVDDLRPGQARNAGTLAERVRDWSEHDMAQFSNKTFEPRETITVTFNGLSYQLIDGQEVTVPEPIWSIYSGHRYAMEQARIHDEYLQGYSDRPPDRNWIAESSAKVRAFSQMGPKPDLRKRGTGPIPMESAAGE